MKKAEYVPLFRLETVEVFQAGTGVLRLGVAGLGKSGLTRVYEKARLSYVSPLGGISLIPTNTSRRSLRECCTGLGEEVSKFLDDDLNREVNKLIDKAQEIYNKGGKNRDVNLNNFFKQLLGEQ